MSEELEQENALAHFQRDQFSENRRLNESVATHVTRGRMQR